MRDPMRLVARIFLFGGIACGVLFVGLTVEQLLFQNRAAIAPGEIVRIDRGQEVTGTRLERGGNPGRFRVIRFAPEGEAPREVQLGTFCLAVCHVGARVMVRYDPADPDRAQIVGEPGSWAYVMGAALFALVWTGLGGGALASDRRMRARMADATAQWRVPARILGIREGHDPIGPHWIVEAEGFDRRHGETRVFRSERVGHDPSPRLAGREAVMVFLTGGESGRGYRMDLDAPVVAAPSGTVAAAALGTAMGGKARPPPRWLPGGIMLLGLLLLAGAGAAVHAELAFRRIAVETDGWIVRMVERVSREDGRITRRYAPVFAFTLPDGRQIEIESATATDPPCCRSGDAVRVRYDPADPHRASMTGFMESWFLPLVLALMGLGSLFLGVVARLAMRNTRRRGAKAGEASGTEPETPPPFEARAVLVGLRQEQGRRGARWIVQARWTDPEGGATRNFESDPLPFDPVPQMTHMSHVLVAFDPALPDGPYRMNLDFLRPPSP